MHQRFLLHSHLPVSKVSSFLGQLISARSFSTSQLEHFLSLPEGVDKYNQINQLIDTQTLSRISIPTTQLTNQLIDSVIRSGSLRHIKQINSHFSNNLSLSPNQIELVLKGGENKGDVEFTTEFLNQISKYTKIESTHLIKLLNCTIKSLESTSNTPFQPFEHVKPFQGNFEKSLELLQQVLFKYQQFDVDLQREELKAILGHLIRIGNFNCAKDLILKVLKENKISIDEPFTNDLIRYFIFKAINCNMDYYLDNISICLKFIKELNWTIPQESSEELFLSLVDNYCLAEFKEMHENMPFGSNLFSKININKLIACCLKYYDYALCIKFLSLIFTNSPERLESEHFVFVFDSILEFDPYSTKSDESKFNQLKEFLVTVKKENPYIANMSELRMGIVKSCSKTLPPESFVAFLNEY